MNMKEIIRNYRKTQNNEGGIYSEKQLKDI